MSVMQVNSLLVKGRMWVKILEFIHHKEKAKDSFSLRIINIDSLSFFLSKHSCMHQIFLCACWPIVMLQTHFKDSVFSLFVLSWCSQ